MVGYETLQLFGKKGSVSGCEKLVPGCEAVGKKIQDILTGV